MTDWTLSSGSICQPLRCPWGAFPTKTFALSTGISSAAIEIGRLVKLDCADAVAQTSVAGFVKGTTGTAGTVQNYLVGISLNAVSGSSAAYNATQIEVAECNPNCEFKAPTKGGVLASSNVGITKKLGYDSTLGIMYVDLTASTAADHRVVITGNIDALGDSGGYVSFKFIQSIMGTVQGTSGSYNSTTPILAFYR